MNFKQGDLIACIDDNTFDKTLTLNKVYSVIKEGYNNIVWIIDDLGEENFYASCRFKLKEVQKPKALRYNNGKLHWSLVHFKSFEPMIKVLEYGANKYSPDNWKKGLDEKELLESLQRHVASLIDKVNENQEPIDEETKLHEIGHIMCNAMFYSYLFVINKKTTNE